MSIQTEFLKPGNPELGIHPPPAQGVDNLPQVTLYLVIQPITLPLHLLIARSAAEQISMLFDWYQFLCFVTAV